MNLRLAITTALFLISSGASAGPTVTGNTISWPNDGWYQVQEVNEDGIFEVCQGGRSCEVSQGEYIVINHSTGERFKDIVVSDFETGVSVEGYVIHWPDNGWYQVQDESDYAEVCAGGRSCRVLPGRYVVINHSTGDRFENIEVPESSPLTVTGNVISWPENGWYQVQTANGAQSICNGGISCEVSSGFYRVINHTTGEQFNNVEVVSIQPQINIENYQSIFEEMATRLFIDFYQPAFDSMQFDDGVTLQSESSVGITTERSYLCNGGGAYETVEEIGGAASSFRKALIECRSEGVTYNGDFDGGISNGVGSVDGWTDYRAISSDTSDQTRFTYRRSRTFATVVSGIELRVADYELVTDVSREKIENMVSSITVNADGIPITSTFEATVLDGLIGSQALTMSTLDSFTDLMLTENQLPVYIAGRLEIVARDNSRLVIEANNGDPESFIALIEHQGSVSSFMVPWNLENILPCKGVNFIDASACELER